MKIKAKEFDKKFDEGKDISKYLDTSKVKMKAKLTKEEQEILDSFEKGEWVPVKNLAKRKTELMSYARNTLKKDKRLNIRISEKDLNELQKKAISEELPYQTYVSSIIHKFVSGRLREAKN
jgi:predicted DNA binding CopG/RHH family protein